MSVSSKMRAILLTGKPDTRESVINLIKVGEVARPQCGPKEALVRVRATAINIEDVMTAVGRRPLVSLAATAEEPVVLGQEFAGVVEEVGNKVKGLAVGDEVLGHKMPFRVRWGSWAEYVTISADNLVKKPEWYTFPQAAALPMSALVAYGAVKAAGLYDKQPEERKPTPESDDSILEPRPGVFCWSEEALNSATIAVVGASSTIGSIMVDMLATRGHHVVGVCSAGNASAVLRNGAVGVFDRNKGGLKLKQEIKFDIVIDAVGGSEVEAAGREALGSKGHFLTVVGPGDGNFGEGTDGGMKNMKNGLAIQSRAWKSMFSSIKYTLASMPFSGGRDVLEKLVAEKVQAILDSEVDMSDEEKVKEAVDRVRMHKTRGRVVLVNN